LADNDLALYPDSMESLQYVFTLYKQTGNVKGVQAVAERMFVLDPNSMDIAMYLAQSKAAAGQLSEAVTFYNKAISMGGNSAEINYTIAGLYQSSGSFSEARRYAEKALSARPGWAKPHILIGRLYASSGPRCGEGTGWDSQVVVWAAIDEWKKAGGDSEAQSLISQYSKYLPTSQDIFMRDGVEDGGQYFVSCWIQRSVTVRPRP
ncbi:MAG: tetratricopeptide repeat protein, partial [Bacteroidota bacterium]|nr:tetratricopeptide repeat protein [Bacteroidota bacterium]